MQLKEFTKRLCDLADEVDGVTIANSDTVNSHQQKTTKRLNTMHAKERRVTWDDEINREKFFDHMKGIYLFIFSPFDY